MRRHGHFFKPSNKTKKLQAQGGVKRSPSIMTKESSDNNWLLNYTGLFCYFLVYDRGGTREEPQNPLASKRLVCIGARYNLNTLFPNKDYF
uniref:Uncharacterized protein n=1 Tax=Kryptolebias marmoratus TaxID=37003 RepID=A0A3Q3APZ6_KRYMA